MRHRTFGRAHLEAPKATAFAAEGAVAGWGDGVRRGSSEAQRRRVHKTRQRLTRRVPSPGGAMASAAEAARPSGGEFTRPDSVCRGGGRPGRGVHKTRQRLPGADRGRGGRPLVSRAAGRYGAGNARAAPADARGASESPPRCPGPVPSREWRGHRGHPVRSRVLCAPASACRPPRVAASPSRSRSRPRSTTSSRSILRPALHARNGRGAATRCDA